MIARVGAREARGGARCTHAASLTRPQLQGVHQRVGCQPRHNRHQPIAKQHCLAKRVAQPLGGVASLYGGCG